MVFQHALKVLELCNVLLSLHRNSTKACNRKKSSTENFHKLKIERIMIYPVTSSYNCQVHVSNKMFPYEM